MFERRFTEYSAYIVEGEQGEPYNQSPAVVPELDVSAAEKILEAL